MNDHQKQILLDLGFFEAYKSPISVWEKQYGVGIHSDIYVIAFDANHYTWTCRASSNEAHVSLLIFGMTERMIFDLSELEREGLISGFISIVKEFQYES